jgi:hypothetical protein
MYGTLLLIPYKTMKNKTQKPLTSYNIYRFLELLTNKRHDTIRQYFNRNKYNPLDATNIITYINKFKR